jgi:parallel beta-helix repeat protein
MQKINTEAKSEMPKKKKSWKEQLRQIQKKQQRAQEVYKIERERAAKRKPRQWHKGKILAALCIIALILGFYGLLQVAKPTDSSNETPETIENPQEMETSGFIYISPNGQVYPSTAPLVNVGNNRYTLTADTQDSIIVYKDNIVVDGSNHLVQGIGEYGSIGVDLTGRKNVTVTNMKIKGFDYGIYLITASRNYISQNEVTNNYYGVYVSGSSSNNIISGNKITSNEMVGVWLKNTSSNKVSENTITLHSNYTIYIGSSENITVSDNYIASNNVGLFIFDCSNNKIYHNKFIDNNLQASTATSTSIWDNGYSSGGNYWSDYEKKYPDAKELESSGIWNTPYVIGEGNEDRYPLVNR